MNTDIVIVSGLPRSGTSLMMQMLESGGLEVVTDHVRTPDTDNPRGYYEFEKVKKVKTDPSWLPQTRGKTFKMVSQLLYDLPPSEQYRIVFMDRNLDEMLTSQEKMLQRLGRNAAPREEMKLAYQAHLDRLHRWLEKQDHMHVLRISYNDLIDNPVTNAVRIADFLSGSVSADGMIAAVDPALYRNRKAEAAH